MEGYWKLMSKVISKKLGIKHPEASEQWRHGYPPIFRSAFTARSLHEAEKEQSLNDENEGGCFDESSVSRGLYGQNEER